MKKVAIIPGDGVGPEVIKQGLKVLKSISLRAICEVPKHRSGNS
jgi:isocitrate/isopropylmalate dehydrogenase